ELRIRRRELLFSEQTPHVWVVLDEAVLHRPVGGPAVMADQIGHLLEAGLRTQVTIQIAPFGVGAHSGLDGSFDILEFPEWDIHTPKLVHLENLASSLYQENAQEVRCYTAAFEHLRTAALRTERTREVLAALQQRMRKQPQEE